MPKIRNYLGRNFQKIRVKEKLSSSSRSRLMTKIVSKGTKFERDFIKLLRKTVKKNPKTNVPNIRGKPDIVFVKKRVIVFLDSDFWHGWQYPRWKHLLKNDFWKTKIRKNRERDSLISRFLKRNGWKVIRIWEHQIKEDPKKTIAKIANYLL